MVLRIHRSRLAHYLAQSVFYVCSIVDAYGLHDGDQTTIEDHTGRLLGVVTVASDHATLDWIEDSQEVRVAL